MASMETTEAACCECPSTNTVIMLECDHAYCKRCLQARFQDELDNLEVDRRDDCLHPPICCGRWIKLDNPEQLLGASLAKDYEKVRVELESNDHTYCWFCERFIHSEIFTENVTNNNTAECPVCGYKTCTECKAKIRGQKCECDRTMQELKKIRKAQESISHSTDRIALTLERIAAVLAGGRPATEGERRNEDGHQPNGTQGLSTFTLPIRNRYPFPDGNADVDDAVNISIHE